MGVSFGKNNIKGKGSLKNRRKGRGLWANMPFFFLLTSRTEEGVGTPAALWPASWASAAVGERGGGRGGFGCCSVESDGASGDSQIASGLDTNGSCVNVLVPVMLSTVSVCSRITLQHDSILVHLCLYAASICTQPALIH